MSDLAGPEQTLLRSVSALRARGRAFALVGGLAVSLRAEVRFTRDVDLAVAVANDEEAELLIHELRSASLHAVATVEHELHRRLATARLRSPEGVLVDLLFASSGLEHEAVARATVVSVSNIGDVPVARSEELLAMKILSMTPRRLQDHIDARNLVEMAKPDLEEVRHNLALIASRGYQRGQDLGEKLEALLASID